MPREQRVTGYRCVTHNFTTTSKVGLQLHQNAVTGPCAIDVIRADADFFEPPALPPKPEPAEPPHDGPHWEHDCDACIYLGSLPHYDKHYDLYFHPGGIGNGRETVLARHGIMGDYVSGMSWIPREPILALAAFLAMREGHLSPSKVL